MSAEQYQCLAKSVNTGASLACPFLKHTSASALLEKPLAYNHALQHFPEPTQLQNKCDGQSHVQHQHPTSWVKLGKSIHFSVSEGEFSLNVGWLLTQGQTSQVEDRNQWTSDTVSHSLTISPNFPQCNWAAVVHSTNQFDNANLLTFSSLYHSLFSHCFLVSPPE